MSLLDLCRRLGRDLDNRFARRNYCVAEFAAIAAELLTSHRHPGSISSEDVVEAALSDELPWQADVESTFGQPAITLFMHPRFRIDALCWRTSTTSIHQHQFAGAFMVLCGSSLQTTFSFTPRTRVTDTFHIGTLEYLASELLQAGHVEPIYFGDELIHSVFHLDVPSISLVVRTHSRIQRGTQFRYERPCLAYDPLEMDYQASKKIQIVDYLCDVRPRGFDVTLMRIVSNCPLPLAFHILRRIRLNRLDRQIWRTLFDAALVAHGAELSALRAVFENSERESRLIRLRKNVRREELRYLLALVLNLPTKGEIMAHVARKAGSAAAASGLVCEWISQILELTAGGAALSAPERTILRDILECGSAGDPRAEARHVRWLGLFGRLADASLAYPLFVDNTNAMNTLDGLPAGAAANDVRV
jgi:hypothetical protein